MTPDLVNTLGIARRLGVTISAVSNWRVRCDNFPASLDIPGVVGIPIWLWTTVHTWAIDTGRVLR